MVGEGVLFSEPGICISVDDEGAGLAVRFFNNAERTASELLASCTKPIFDSILK